MKIFTKKLFGLMALLMVGGMTFAQTVLWGGTGDPNGEFAGGLNDWTVASNDPDGQWVWDADGAPTLGSFDNGSAINSPSVSNGAAVFDSDYYDNYGGGLDSIGLGPAPSPQLGELISPIIDLTGNSLVSLKFNQYFRQFSSECFIAWSNDGGASWVDTVAINENLIASQDAALSIVNGAKVVPLPGGGNTSQFRFKFIFDADYYFWVIDDVSIIERPEFDLMVSNLFYTPASYAQPITQIKSDTMGFSVDVANVGRTTQEDVSIKVQILKGSTVVYTDEKNIGTLLPESADSTYSLDETFIPDMLTTGVYILRYSVSSANTDFDATNNTIQENFRVTTNYFAKEDEDEDFETAFILTNSPEDYRAGNLYNTSTNWVDQYQATSAEFAFYSPDSDPIGNKSITVNLVAVNDDVSANWDEFENDNTDFPDHPNLTWLGFGDYTFPTGYNNFSDVTIPLLETEEFLPGVVLEPGKRYLLMADFIGSANTISLVYNTKIDYFNRISTVTVSDRWYLGGFGSEFAAVARLNISLYNASDEVALPDNSLTFYPNPASSELTVDIDLEEPTLANVTIADLNGRVIEIDEIEKAYKQTRQYDVSNLPNGTYLVRIATKAGTKTKKFVVQH